MTEQSLGMLRRILEVSGIPGRKTLPAEGGRDLVRLLYNSWEYLKMKGSLTGSGSRGSDS